MIRLRSPTSGEHMEPPPGWQNTFSFFFFVFFCAVFCSHLKQELCAIQRLSTQNLFQPSQTQRKSFEGFVNIPPKKRRHALRRFNL